MRKLAAIICCLLPGFIIQAQDFPGYRSGNYTGVNSVFFNPANIADSRYRFDINLISVSTFVGNDQASFDLKTVGETFDPEKLSNQIFHGNAGPTSALVNATIHGPSFMFNVGKKSAVAITTRARVMANVVDIDGALLNQLSEDANPNTSLPYTIQSGNNMRVATNAWTEFGASYAREIYAKGAHFVKGGVTIKYLGGAGNAFINIDQLNTTIDEDANGTYLRNTTGRLGVGFGGINFSDFEPNAFLKMSNSGFGADLGFVYEYRPGLVSTGRDQNKYKLRVGVALTDLGSISYTKDRQRSGTYNMDITGPEKFYLEDLEETDFDDYNQFFASRPQYFQPVAGNNDETYKVSLPSAMHVDVDYHINKGFYVNASGMFSMVGKQSKVQNSMYYSSFSITPRIEGKSLGLYLPLTYNSLTQFNAGVSFRLGPLFVGSGSIISSLLGDTKQADVHVGIRLGGLYKR